MDLASIRKIVTESPHGVAIRMIDGTEYRLKHRDYITLGPPPEERSLRSQHYTAFMVWDDGPTLVNALLVKEVVPLKGNGNGNGHGGKGKKGKLRGR